MNAFDKTQNSKGMPQSDQDKDSTLLLNEIKTFIVNPTYLAKVNELLDREIKANDSDDIQVGGVNATRGGIRPKHAPLV